MASVTHSQHVALSYTARVQALSQTARRRLCHTQPGTGSVTHMARVQALSHTPGAHAVTHTSRLRLCHTHGQGTGSVTHGWGWWNLSGGKLAVCIEAQAHILQPRTAVSGVSHKYLDVFPNTYVYKCSWHCLNNQRLSANVYQQEMIKNLYLND